MNDKVKIFALGGLDEHGKNMYVIEINNDIFGLFPFVFLWFSLFILCYNICFLLVKLF